MVAKTKEAEAIKNFIENAAKDGKDYVIKISAKELIVREAELKRRKPLTIGEMHSLGNNLQTPALMAEIIPSCKKLAPGWFSELFFGINGQIKSIYRQAIKILAPIDEKNAAKKILTKPESFDSFRCT